MDQSAKDLINAPEIVKAFGREYEIKRFTLGPFIEASEHIAPLGYLMQGALDGDISATLVKALAVGGRPALGLISVATREPIEWLDDKDPVDGAELLAAIVEKNIKYFFDSANKQRLKAAFDRISNAVKTEFGATSTTSAQPMESQSPQS